LLRWFFQENNAILFIYWLDADNAEFFIPFRRNKKSRALPHGRIRKLY